MSPPVIYGFPPKSYKQKGLKLSVEPNPQFTNTHSKINHALPLVQDCMSISPQIWQQFVDLVFQDDIFK